MGCPSRRGPRLLAAKSLGITPFLRRLAQAAYPSSKATTAPTANTISTAQYRLRPRILPVSSLPQPVPGGVGHAIERVHSPMAITPCEWSFARLSDPARSILLAATSPTGQDEIARTFLALTYEPAGGPEVFPCSARTGQRIRATALAGPRPGCLSIARPARVRAARCGGGRAGVTQSSGFAEFHGRPVR
jgi:hypothetical protein